MITDDQLIERIRTVFHREVGGLHPPADLLERLQSAPEPRRTLPRGVGRAIAALASIAGVAVVVAAFVSLGHRHVPPSGVAVSAGAPAGARPLVAKLAVLRRPQTASDRLPESVSSRLTTSDPFRVYLIPRLTRLAATIRMGPGPLAAVDIYLVVVKPPTAPVDIATTLVVAGLPGHRYLMDPPEVVDDQTAVETRGLTPTAVGLHTYTAMYGGAKTNKGVNVAVVPDGVWRVKWVFTRGFRVTRGVVVTVYPKVENNVAVATTTEFGSLFSATWYSPDRRVFASLSPQAQQSAEYAQALAASVRRPIAPALIEHLAVFRRPVPPPATIKPLPQRTAALLARNDPDALNVAQARFVPYPGTPGVWIVPGTLGVTTLNPQPCRLIDQPPVCGSGGGGSAPTSVVLSGADIGGFFGPHRETIWGVAPDGNKTVTAVLANGTRRVVRVIDNVYSITVHPQSVYVIEKDASGRLVSNNAP